MTEPYPEDITPYLRTARRCRQAEQQTLAERRERAWAILYEE